MVQVVVTRKGLWQLSTDVVGNRVKYSELSLMKEGKCWKVLTLRNQR